MYTVWVTSYYTDIFPYTHVYTPLLLSTFSMSKDTVTMDTTNATHVHMINLLFHRYRNYHSLSRQHCTCACVAHAIRALTTHDISLYVWNKIANFVNYFVRVWWRGTSEMEGTGLIWNNIIILFWLCLQSPWNQFFQDNELKQLIRQDVVRTFPDVQFFKQDYIQWVHCTLQSKFTPLPLPLPPPTTCNTPSFIELKGVH